MITQTTPPRLKLMRGCDYTPADGDDPIRFYHWPVFGKLYRRRVELCLAECKRGRRVLEVGFGSGVSFLNLSEIFDEIHGIDLTSPVAEVAAGFRDKGIDPQLSNGSVLHMPYPDNHFDTVLLISILEHLKPEQQVPACREIARVLRPGGQMVYGVPVERPFMVCMFRLLGYNIRDHHFSTEQDVANAAGSVLRQERLVPMKSFLSFLGPVYEVGHFVKPLVA